MRHAVDFSGFTAVLYKELLHVSRDRITLILALVLPVVQLLIFGYAVNTKVEHIGTAYLNEDRGAISVRALDALRASSQFDLVREARNRDELRRLIVGNRVKVAIDIPPNFSADVASGKGAQLQVLIDGSDSNIAQQAFAATVTIGTALSAELGPPVVVGSIGHRRATAHALQPESAQPELLHPRPHRRHHAAYHDLPDGALHRRRT